MAFFEPQIYILFNWPTKHFCSLFLFFEQNKLDHLKKVLKVKQFYNKFYKTLFKENKKLKNFYFESKRRTFDLQVFLTMGFFSERRK